MVGDWLFHIALFVEVEAADVPPLVEALHPDRAALERIEVDAVTRPCRAVHEVQQRPLALHEHSAGVAVVDELVFADDFESDQGWVAVDVARGGEWTRGPMFDDYDLDPPSAFSGDNVWGTDLGDGMDGNPNGRYRNNMASYLEGPVIDCSALSGATLGYRRWLTVESSQFDVASIQVNGIEVWRNPANAQTLHRLN